MVASWWQYCEYYIMDSSQLCSGDIVMWEWSPDVMCDLVTRLHHGVTMTWRWHADVRVTSWYHGFTVSIVTSQCCLDVPVTRWPDSISSVYFLSVMTNVTQFWWLCNFKDYEKKFKSQNHRYYFSSILSQKKNISFGKMKIYFVHHTPHHQKTKVRQHGLRRLLEMKGRDKSSCPACLWPKTPK